jgi:KDO2-lipid IV(A) lauroyltransferase
MFWRKALTSSLDYAVYVAVRCCICLIQFTSLETAESASRILARIFTDWLPIRRKVVKDNLRKAFPELSPAEQRKMTRRMWRHLLLMIFEIAHAHRKIRDITWRKHVRLVNEAVMVDRLLDDRPVQIVTGHFGNFEVAGLLLGLLGFPSFTIARPLDNPYLHYYFLRLRSRFGQFILPKEGVAPFVEHVLKNNGVLTVLGDQHGGPKGCWVNFFGQPASCHKALAVFTLTGDAPMVVTYCRRRDRALQFDLGVQASADPRTLDEYQQSVKGLTQWYNDQLETIIRRDPDQYWWLHRRFRGEPPLRGKAKAASQASSPAEGAA